ncbi:MAG: AIR synthase related protein, partial [Deltaproteobacteria bacterium]|nr:AIR synthase related protein [Deltaproteobacteria bacterium]
TTDCNGRYVYLEPFTGAAIAVAEAARNLACSGAKPLGLTDCLNFGNPYKPEVFYQFKRSVEGIIAACNSLQIPVISGNVSFYNESLTHSVYPTPLIGMVGLIEDLADITTQWFKQEGDVVYLAGNLNSKPDIGGSEYLKTVHKLVTGKCPELDLEKEKALHSFLLSAISSKLLQSAHDCSEGGLAVALAECCISGNSDSIFGISADMDQLPGRPDFKLFAENQSRAIVSCQTADVEKLEAEAKRLGVEVVKLGIVGKERFVIKGLVDLPVSELRKAWEEAIPEKMK